MGLKLEDHVFRILQNQKKLGEYLGEHQWSFNMDKGLLTFFDKQGKVLIEFPVQIIGTEGYKANTWLWSWANTKSNIPDNLLVAANTIKEAGTKENLDQFTKAELPLEPNLGVNLSIISAGYLGHFAYFPCKYEGGCMYVTIEKPPVSINNVTDFQTVFSTLRMGMSSFKMNQKQAVMAYLGDKYTILEPNKFKWDLDTGSVEIQFEENDSIKEFKASPKK